MTEATTKTVDTSQSRAKRLRVVRLPIPRDFLLWAAMSCWVLYGLTASGSAQLVLINTALLFSIGALATQVLVGFTHLISLGHMAFLVLGVVCSSIVTQLNDYPPVLALLVSTLGGAILGFIVGLPALRIRGLYLILATLALHFIALYAMREFQLAHFLNVGAIAVGHLDIFGIEVSGERAWTMFLTPIVVVIALVLASLLKSRHGRGMLALSNNELAASTLGVPVARVKLTAFAISSALLAMLGSLQSFYNRSVGLEGLSLDVVITYYVMVVIGGLGGNIVGAVIGAIFVAVSPRLLTWVGDNVLSEIPGIGPFVQGHLAEVQLLVYGLAICVVMLFAPKGLRGLYYALFDAVRRLVRVERRRKESEAADA